MKSYIIDIETVGQASEILEARMPEEIRNPQMPDNIANPPAVDLSGCPAYASIKDEEAREAKREAWRTDKREKAEQAALAARQKWELGVVEARTKFVQNAALDAKLGHAKLIGMKDVQAGMHGVSTVYVWEPDPKQMSRIRAWVNSLQTIQYGSEKPLPVVGNHGQLILKAFMTEAAMLTDFFIDFKETLDSPSLDVRVASQCVTYCGNSFDFPFLYRRSWLTGAPQVPMFRRGRYWDESRMVDLRDLWTFGSREDKDRSGGLDNLAAALGYDRPKLQDGANFHRFYQEDPTEGLMYNVADLSQTEWVARRMGVIR